MITALIVGTLMSVVVQLAKRYVEVVRQYPKIVVLAGSAIALFVLVRVVSVKTGLLLVVAFATSVAVYEVVIKRLK